MVEILASQVGVTTRGDDFKDTIVNGEQRNVKSSATKVKYKNVLLTGLFVEAISNGSRSGLSDNVHDVEAGDGASILGGLLFGIIIEEFGVGRDSDHRILHLVAKECRDSLFFHLDSTICLRSAK